MLWAGYDHLARARAIAAYFVDRKDADGWAAGRLAPLLAGLQELVPWLKQWHNALDLESGLHMGEYFEQFVEDEARDLGLTLVDLKRWRPPAPIRKTAHPEGPPHDQRPRSAPRSDRHPRAGPDKRLRAQAL